MVPRSMIRSAYSVTTLLLLGAMPAVAGPITLTGNVAQDFQPTPLNGVQVIPNSLGPVAMDPALVAKGFVSGFSVQDIRLSYDQATDKLYVGVNTLGIAGDADGNGNPGTADPYTTSKNGNDLPHFGGAKTITLGFANDANPNAPVIVAGIPSVKPAGTNGIQNYQVSASNGSGDLSNSYGTKLTANQGGLAFDPSAAHPGFEFFISNFSKIPGLNPKNSMWVSAIVGATDALVVGETFMGPIRIPALAPQNTPEPTTLLAWGAVAAGAVVYNRRRKGRASSV